MSKITLKGWPGGARIAVMVTVLYESWTDDEVPVHCPMVLAAPMKTGTLDLHGVNWAEYGGETGIWRLLELMDRHSVKSTVCANARAIERYPQAARAICEAGHEVAAHAYAQQDLMPYLDVGQERALIGRCTDAIASCTGKAPIGWISPRATPTRDTASLLAQFGYRWHGDYNDTDLPYVLETNSGSLVALAHSDFTDIRVIRGSPRDYLNVHKDVFDFLYASGRPEIINLSIHAHYGGRPLIASMFSQILEYYRRFEGVWFARHDEIADWVVSQHAAQGAPGGGHAGALAAGG